jgi:hypothetical protein
VGQGSNVDGPKSILEEHSGAFPKRRAGGQHIVDQDEAVLTVDALGSALDAKGSFDVLLTFTVPQLGLGRGVFSPAKEGHDR